MQNPLNTTEQNLTAANERINKLEGILDNMYRSFFELIREERTEQKFATNKHIILWDAIMEYDVIRKVKPTVDESTAKTV